MVMATLERQEVNQQTVATCPSCGHHGHFSYAGEQRWPKKVALACGLPEVITLWLCENCHSNISETELLD
jgi:hypothetical protein